MKTMVIDGNAKVGEVEVFRTQLELTQRKEIESLKDIITDGFNIIQKVELYKVGYRKDNLHKNFCEIARKIIKSRRKKS